MSPIFSCFRGLLGHSCALIRNQLYFGKVKSVVARYREPLMQRKSQLVVKDKFGINTADWERDKIAFIRKFLLPLPTNIDIQQVSRSIEKELKIHAAEAAHLPIIETRLDYQKYCADRLSRSGWKVTHPGIAGDHNVDFFGTIDDVTAVFHCTWYSRPITDLDVQQVVASRHALDADLAIVIVNGRFTLAARRLAEQTGVDLLHHSQIEEFTDVLIEMTEPAQAQAGHR